LTNVNIDNHQYEAYTAIMNGMDLLPTMIDSAGDPDTKGCCEPVPQPAAPVPDTAVARFKALADHTRLGILALLSANDEAICVCDLNDHFDLEQPTISHHLKVLRKAGLIASERRGSWAYYHLHPATAGWVRATLAGLPR
jgi:ArsR family transcriptional regulator, arsenate/arsenite/antimonite-responsive transcriptional repressor